MKSLLNIILILAIIAAVLYAYRAEASYSPETPWNTGNPARGSVLSPLGTEYPPSDFVNESQALYGISAYSIENALSERPNTLIARLLGSFSGPGAETDTPYRMELALQYEKVLALRSYVVSEQGIAPTGKYSRSLERKDRSLSRDKRILETNYPFVRMLAGTRIAENEVQDYIRPLLDETFYELSVDEVMATIEGIGGNIEAGKYRDAREAVAMFLVREIYMERVDAALRFICEVPSCQNTPVSLGSAPPAVEYFFEQQFGAFEARGCGDGTVDTPEIPCRELPEPLATAVQTAVTSFECNIVAYDDTEFYFLFLDYANPTTQKNVTGARISLLDPVGSGKRLADAYVSALNTR